MSYQTKIPLFDLFNDKNDVRKYCRVDIPDDQQETVCDEFGIDMLELDAIMGRAVIYVSGGIDKTTKIVTEKPLKSKACLKGDQDDERD